MFMKNLSYYINCFSTLHTMKIKEKPAPHKALLLLSVIDLVEQGVITDSCIPLSDILEKQFKQSAESPLSLFIRCLLQLVDGQDIGCSLSMKKHRQYGVWIGG